MEKQYTKSEMIEELDKIDIGDHFYNEIKRFIEDLD